MTTTTIINILGLDPQVWTEFRALLATRKLSVSKWATQAILDTLSTADPDNPTSV